MFITPTNQSVMSNRRRTDRSRAAASCQLIEIKKKDEASLMSYAREFRFMFRQI